MEGLSCGTRVAIGSLPGMDASQAVRFQCRAFPEVPAWPQLPKRHPNERITHQGLGGLPGLVFRPEGGAQWTEPAEGWSALERGWAADLASGAYDQAALSQTDAPGFFAFLQEAPRYFTAATAAVKGQCAGPLTLGLSLHTREGRSLLESASAMGCLSRYLALHALWQCRELSALGRPVVFFLDEPSAGHLIPEKFGRSWEEILGWYDLIFAPLQEAGVLTGFHLCGKGPFGFALRSSAECVHIDADRYLDHLKEDAAEVQHFLTQGGVVAFGLVPTAMSGGTFPEAASLVDRYLAFTYAMGRLGVDPGLLSQRSWFSTSCGLGGGSQAVAEEAARCLSDTVALWRIASGVGLSR